MALKKINKLFSADPRFKRFQKPLEAARVCEAGALCVDASARIVSFKNGLLTVAVTSSAAAANMQMESAGIIECINKKLGQELVKKLKYKIV